MNYNKAFNQQTETTSESSEKFGFYDRYAATLLTPHNTNLYLYVRVMMSV